MQPEASYEMEDMRYVGIDVGKRRCSAAIMDQRGSIINEFKFTNNRQDIEDLASRLTMDDKVVIESTGSVWVNLYDRFDERQTPVVLANPLKTKAIASAKIKSDRVDARILAHLLRANLIPESYVSPKELRELRALIRHRASIVKIRTMAKNKIHTLLDKHGLTSDCSDIFGKRGMEWLRSLELPSLDRLILSNHLEHIDSLNHQIKRIDEEIRVKASKDEYVKLLLSMTGIDVYTALLIRSEIGGIDRFPDYKKLVSWAGWLHRCINQEA
jgi:transposase